MSGRFYAIWKAAAPQRAAAFFGDFAGAGMHITIAVCDGTAPRRGNKKRPIQFYLYESSFYLLDLLISAFSKSCC